MGLIWGVVNNIVQRGTEQVDLSSRCLALSLEVTQTNCVLGSDGDDCDITIKRNAGGDSIAGFKLVLTNASGESNFVQDVSGNMNPLDLKTVTITEIGLSNVNLAEIVPYLEDEFGNAQDCTV